MSGIPDLLCGTASLRIAPFVMRSSFAFIQPEFLFWPLVALLVGWWLVMRLRKVAGIWRLRYFALPRPWLKYLHAHVPLYSRLPWELRAPYQDKVLNFVDGKIFRPGGSLDEVPEPNRIVIAGNACLLLLNSGADVIFPAVLSVQIYPPDEADPQGKSSCVPLLWDDEKKQPLDPHNRGREKELAAIAAALGAKSLPQPLLLTPWARARMAEFTAAYPDALDNLAEGDPADVFGIATEVFYDAPAALQASHPALYNSMRLFYKVDPARWPSARK